ncbi:HEAT repeat domain-containing protein [uncultured Croceitalea sp.]|uniref:HEAT repeat domain-containing protein n=1 Tax=uncultured Croceitalea sp. TaxID=1798908 RepID=UPI003305C19F
MNEEQFEVMAMAYLKDEISKENKMEFEAFIANNTDYRKEFDALTASWNDFDSIVVPEPSENMDKAFFQMLGSAIEKEKERLNWATQVQEILALIFRPQLAYGILILALGVSVGYFMKQDNTIQQIEPKVVSNDETEEVREKLVLTLLEQPSANKRLEGVNEANKISKVDETVINALLKTLNSDANVNVRLAAIESLTNYVDNPVVRQGLIQSIPNQESPIIQVTLANLMVALQEKKSVEPFKQLLREKQLDTTVKKKIENSIESII